MAFDGSFQNGETQVWIGPQCHSDVPVRVIRYYGDTVVSLQIEIWFKRIYMQTKFIFLVIASLIAVNSYAKECWAITDMKGQMAPSTNKYEFEKDKFSNPMVLCFNDDKTGSVTGDDTQFVKFGSSTLIGWATNKGIELAEVYQIDRLNQKALFTKSRIGTQTVVPNGPDVVAAFVGNAKQLTE